MSKHTCKLCGRSKPDDILTADLSCRMGGFCEWVEVKAKDSLSDLYLPEEEKLDLGLFRRPRAPYVRNGLMRQQ